VASQKSGRSVLLLVILAGLIGAGAWNYDRNLRKEEAAPRPYRGYADAQLTALLDAYEKELEGLRGRASAGGVAAGGQRLMDNVVAFERTRAAADAARMQQGDLAQREAIVRELRKEQQTRAQVGSGMAVHLRRLTSW
jgi:hypothetical protein